MAEGTSDLSVFQYGGDNPIMGSDPGGNKSVAPGASAIIDSDVAGQAMYQNSGFTDWVENQQDIETSDNYQSYQQALASTRGSPEQLEAQQARSEADMATPGSTDMVLQAGLFAFNVRNNTASTGVDVTVTITPTGLTIESNMATGVANPDYVAPAPGQMPTTTQYMALLVHATAFFPLGNTEDSGYDPDVDPSTLYHNIFYTNYIGPWNPKSYGGRWNYQQPPVNRADVGAERHDMGYDKLYITGASGVFTNMDAIPYDKGLVKYEFDLFADPNNGATLTERLEGWIVGEGIGIAILPKQTVNALNQATQSGMNMFLYPGY